MSYPLHITIIGESGLSVGTAFRICTTRTLPAGLSEDTTYYIIADEFTESDFMFSTTYGGSAVEGTQSYTGTCWIVAAPAKVTTYEVSLEWSDDGCHTWSNKHMMSIGATGKYNYRSIVRRLGRSRERIFRLTFTMPVKCVVLGAFAEIEETVG